MPRAGLHARPLMKSRSRSTGAIGLQGSCRRRYISGTVSAGARRGRSAWCRPHWLSMARAKQGQQWHQRLAAGALALGAASPAHHRSVPGSAPTAYRQLLYQLLYCSCSKSDGAALHFPVWNVIPPRSTATSVPGMADSIGQWASGDQLEGAAAAVAEWHQSSAAQHRQRGWMGCIGRVRSSMTV